MQTLANTAAIYLVLVYTLENFWELFTAFSYLVRWQCCFFQGPRTSMKLVFESL